MCISTEDRRFWLKFSGSLGGCSVWKSVRSPESVFPRHELTCGLVVPNSVLFKVAGDVDFKEMHELFHLQGAIGGEEWYEFYKRVMR